MANGNDKRIAKRPSSVNVLHINVDSSTLRSPDADMDTGGHNPVRLQHPHKLHAYGNRSNSQQLTWTPFDEPHKI